MFKHPIRDLVVLSLVGWFTRRKINRMGGWRHVFSRSSSPYRRSRTARSH